MLDTKSYGKVISLLEFVVQHFSSSGVVAKGIGGYSCTFLELFITFFMTFL